MRTFTPRIPGAESTQNDYITYTISSFENGNGGISDARVDSLRKTPPGVFGGGGGYFLRDTSNLPLLIELPDSLPISGLELGAAAISEFQLRFFLMGKTNDLRR